jgi:hypothetical protein
MRGRILAALAAIMAMTACGASAATYCVPAHAGCAGTTEPTLAAAISAANGDTAVDDILIGPGSFPASNIVASASNPVHIAGSGMDTTRLEGATSGFGLTLYGEAQSIADLTIHEPDNGHSTALYLDGGVARNVRVDQRDNSAGSATAVGLFHGAAFTDGEALARTTTVPTTYGIYMSNDASEAGLVSNVTAQGGYGIDAEGAGSATVRFARVTGKSYGIIASMESGALVDDSTVTGGPLVGYLSTGTADVLTTVRHVTLNGTYAGVESYVNGHTSRMIVSNTGIVGGGPDPETADLDIETLTGAVGRIEADYSFFRAAHVIQSGTGTEQYVPGAHNIDGADAKLLDVVHGDLRPRFDSPLIDAGDPVPGGGEPMADLAGEFRAVNGRTDIGAYEYGRHTPTISAAASAISARTGEPITFSAATNDADPAEFPDVIWTFDDGTSVRGLTAVHAFATTGTHSVTATATDPSGLKATAPVSVTVTAPVLAAARAPAFGFKKLKARKGVVAVVLSCPVLATDCSGTIELRLAPKPKAKGTGVAAKTIVLGKAGYAMVHGARKTIKVKLNKSARKRLRRARHGLFVKVIAKPNGAASRSKTVRLTGR